MGNTFGKGAATLLAALAIPLAVAPAAHAGQATDDSGPATAAAPGAAALCKSRTAGFAGKWGPVSEECSYTSPASGWKGKLKISWNAQQGPACVEARMGSAKNTEKWQSLSCGQHGSGTIRWPKNTASNVEVRVRAQQTPVVNVEYYI